MIPRSFLDSAADVARRVTSRRTAGPRSWGRLRPTAKHPTPGTRAKVDGALDGTRAMTKVGGDRQRIAPRLEHSPPSPRKRAQVATDGF